MPGGRGEQAEHRGFLVSSRADTCDYTFVKPVKSTALRTLGSNHVSVQVISGAGSAEGWTCVGTGRMWRISGPSVQFSCESEIAYNLLF